MFAPRLQTSTTATKRIPTPGKFGQFPAELVEGVLKGLPVTDVVAFQRVCRYFYDLVKSSPVLSHKILRYLTETTNMPSLSHAVLPQRLEYLRELDQQTRQGYRPTLMKTIGITANAKPVLSGPLVALSTGNEIQHSLRFNRVASTVHGRTEEELILQGLPSFHSFAYDYDQDLLALLFHVDTRSVLLHILSCTTGEAHPLARSPIHLALPVELDSGHREFCELLICADMVGLMCFPCSGAHLWVWNWKTGDTVLRIFHENDDERPEPQGFAFLDANHVLIATGGISNTRVLAIYDCYSLSNDPGALRFYDSLRTHAHVVLGLPPTASGNAQMHVCVSCRPSGQSAEVRGDDVRRVRWTPAAVVVVQLTVDDVQGSVRYFDLVVPGDALLARLALSASSDRAAGETVPWTEWSADTRLFERDDDDNVHTAVCGSLYASVGAPPHVLGRRRNRGQRVVVLHHFAPRPVLRRLRNMDPGIEFLNMFDKISEPDEGVVWCPAWRGDRRVWEGDWTEGAWFRRMRTTVDVAEGECVEIGEGVVLVYGRERMRVYAMQLAPDS